MLWVLISENQVTDEKIYNFEIMKHQIVWLPRII